MVLWHDWLVVIQHVLAFLAYDLHLGMGLGIILMTLAARSALLPLTWTGTCQADIRLGLYQVLRAIRGAGRFLWIANLSRPDFWLAMIAGAATMAFMAMNPDLPEHVRIVLILIPAIFTVLAALKFSAALSLYWTTTNAFSGVQAIALRAVATRRARGEVRG